MIGFPVLPPTASTFAGELNPLFWTLVALTALFTLIVAACVVLFAIKYQRGSDADRSHPHDEHMPLETTWIIVPLILGIAIFVWGAALFAQARQPPANAMEVTVIGKQWMWHFEHANGIRENNELHVPIGVPVKLTMISQDVVHDLFIPAFRIHQDVIPGVYTTEWFQATQTGKYHLFCAQYCGTNHSEMTGYVYALTQPEYEHWLANGGPGGAAGLTIPSPIQSGSDLWDTKACGSCHTAVDTMRGPSLVGLYGTQQRLATGQTVIADDQFLRNMIMNPEDRTISGYAPTMPSYKELTEDQILDLLAYIKSLGPTQSGTTGSAGAARRPGKS